MDRKHVNIDKSMMKNLRKVRAGVKFDYIDRRSFMDNEDITHVYPVSVTEKQVYICCPFCKEFHVHGKVKGMRESHCKDKVGVESYYIEL